MRLINLDDALNLIKYEERMLEVDEPDIDMGSELDGYRFTRSLLTALLPSVSITPTSTGDDIAAQCENCHFSDLTCAKCPVQLFKNS